MGYKVRTSKLELIKGDITQQETDAVVNAANSELAPGGGVAGAIHRVAGPKLWDECKKLGGCKTGEAKITAGYNLRAKYIIHTVGPIYGSTSNDAKFLVSSYEASLRLAEEYRLESVSFPSISTGAFGYPVEDAAEIAIRTVAASLRGKTVLKLVRFVLFSDYDLKTYREAAEKLLS